MNNKTRRKIDLYILSLGVLFVFLFVITVQPPDSEFYWDDAASWKCLAEKNFLSAISVIGIVYCLCAYVCFDFELKSSGEIPFEITKLDNANHEHMTFLATYVVPLMSLDVGDNRQVIVLVLLLVIMGAIYVKTDLFYANPSLALVGFRVYRASGEFKNNVREGIILICRERLCESQKVAYIKLDDRIYYVRSVK